MRGTGNAVDGNELLRACAALNSGTVLIVGDCMLDKYLHGDAWRISPEAPVPVVLVEKETHLLGGAGNVARNVRALGGRVRLLGVRGDDAAGSDLSRCLERDALADELLIIPGRQTTVKTRVLARQQQVVRIDAEHSGPLDPEHGDHLLDKLAKALDGCGAVVVSDYGKGVVSAGFMRALHTLVVERGGTIPILVDPKPQNSALYSGVTLLTPNARETSEASGLPVSTAGEIVLAGRALMRRLELQHLVTTLGSRGMAVFPDAETVLHIPTMAREVFDVTGAGDTVIATVGLGLAAGLDLVTACLVANYAAGIVVGEVGAATVSLQQLRERVAAQELPEMEEWGDRPLRVSED